MIFNMTSSGSVSTGDILGIAMNNAEKGDVVQVSTKGMFSIPEDTVVLCGSMCIASPENTFVKELSKIYKVPTINKEVPKIELD